MIHPFLIRPLAFAWSLLCIFGAGALSGGNPGRLAIAAAALCVCGGWYALGKLERIVP